MRCKSQAAAIIRYQMQSNAIIHSFAFTFTHAASAPSHWPWPINGRASSSRRGSNLIHCLYLWRPVSFSFSLCLPVSRSVFLSLSAPLTACAPVSRKCVRSLNGNIFAECQWCPDNYCPLLHLLSPLNLSTYLRALLSLSLSLSFLFAVVVGVASCPPAWWIQREHVHDPHHHFLWPCVKNKKACSIVRPHIIDSSVALHLPSLFPSPPANVSKCWPLRQIDTQQKFLMTLAGWVGEGGRRNGARC